MGDLFEEETCFPFSHQLVALRRQPLAAHAARRGSPRVLAPPTAQPAPAKEHGDLKMPVGLALLISTTQRDPLGLEWGWSRARCLL